MSADLRERIAQALHEQRSKRYYQHPSLLKDCVPEYQRDTLGDADAILALFAPQLAARDATIVVSGMREKLLAIERHCPCGARPESPNTHHHVGGCPVYEALALTPPALVERAEAERALCEAAMAFCVGLESSAIELDPGPVTLKGNRQALKKLLLAARALAALQETRAPGEGPA